MYKINRMISKRVCECTNVTTGKNKSKFFKTSFGNFSYGGIPLKVYPYDVLIQEAQERSYLIAKNLKELESVLLEDLRIDENNFTPSQINHL